MYNATINIFYSPTSSSFLTFITYHLLDTLCFIIISPHYHSVPGRFGVLGDRRDVRGVLLCSGLRQEEGAGHISFL